MTTDELTASLTDSLNVIYDICSTQEDLSAAQEELKGLDEKTKAIAQGFLYHIRGTLFLALGIIIGFCIDIVISRILYWVLGLPFNDVVAAILLVVCILIGYILLLSQPHKAKAEAFRQEREATLKQTIAQSTEALRQLANSSAFQQMHTLLLDDYVTIDAVAFFLTAVKNKRADTLKEAINLYEAERHSREMVEMQQQELDLFHQSIELAHMQLDAQQKILHTESSIGRTQSELLRKTKKISKQIRFSNAVGIINTVRHWSDCA